MLTKSSGCHGRVLAGILVACACAQAGVTTNHWTNADGGGVCATNETGHRANLDVDAVSASNVLHFALHDGAVIYNDGPQNAVAAPAGMVFEPVEDETNPWPTWQLINISGGGFGFCPNYELGYIPLSVTGGTLVFGDSVKAVEPRNGNTQVVRKEGNGTIRVSKFYNGDYPGRTLEIADGTVIPMNSTGLRYMCVKETSETGRLVFTNYTTAVGLGTYEPYQGRAVDAQGNNLVFGSMAPTRFPSSVTNFSQLSAVATALVVTNFEPGAVYLAQTGRLRLDSKTGEAIPFAKYDFEDSLTKDASGHDRDLVAYGTVTRIEDAGRGWVAHFTATANSGGRLEVKVAGQKELTGDTDYTVSLWAKTASTPTANGYPTMFSLGESTADHQIVQFRFSDANCSTLLLGHWGSPGDYTNIPATATPDVWHHYIIMRDGGAVSVWIDGARVQSWANQEFVMALPQTVTITLGKLPTMDRYFAGDLDDVRIYARALGEDGVRRLFRGEEPLEWGPDAVSGEPLALPTETRLETGLNGEIYLAGTPTVTNIYGDAVLGGVAMPGGGELRMTGPGRYNAGVAGSADFVKIGNGKLTLGGTLTHTGATRVESGTLALAPLATLPRPVVMWDFEDPNQFGADATGGQLPITAPANGVTRVWDDERQSHVARINNANSPVFGTTRKTELLTGNSDYTVSVWVKPDADCPAEGTFVSFGVESDRREAVFRYKDINSGLLCLSHWGGTHDFVDVTSPANPQGAWHHYAATRRRDVFTVYCDGEQVWTRTVANTKLDFPFEKKFAVGVQVKAGNASTRYFKGDLDDVRIYGAALEASDIARLAAGREPTGAAPGVAPAIDVPPAPVMHYAFEDASQPGKDSAPGANHLTKMGTGTFRFVDSPLGGKALQFDRANQTYLKSTSFPTALPESGRPFTVSLWVQTSPFDRISTSSHYPTFLCWGNPGQGTIGYMLSYWFGSDANGWATIRNYLRRSGGQNSHDINSDTNLLGLRNGPPELRWHHYAAVYDPANGFYCYVDGRGYSPKDGAFANDMCREGGVFYLGAKSTNVGTMFRGALDEVKIFDQALDIHQIRAVMRADAGKVNVLPTGARVTVAEGATLDVGGSDESFAALEGAGTLAVDGRVALAGTNTFNGPVVGTGTVALPEGASLTLGTACADYAGYWDVAPGAEVVPPAGVTSVGGTFRPTRIDAAAQAAYPGDVEIADGTAIAVTTANHGPLVAAAGRVTIAGGGTVTLPTPKTTGDWVIARGASVVDAGTGDLNARWTVTNAGTNVRPRFFASNGSFVCRVSGSGSMLIVR